MSTITHTAWTTAHDVLAKQRGTHAAADIARGQELAAEFRQHGCWRMTPTQALGLSSLSVVVFYESLGTEPQQKAGPNWMLDSDYAFLNVRACSPHRNKTGNVLDAMKILPTMRVSAIHIAPFFDCCMDNLYAVDSVRVVSDAVLEPALLEAGLDGDEQMRLLIDAIHRLGWRAGFDLEPHTSNFSRIVMAHPDCFRWLRFDAKREKLYGDVTQEEMLEPGPQKKLAREVKALVAEVLRKHALKEIEDLSKGVETVRLAHQEALRALIDAGYWTLPSHTWGGVGLPQFDYYKDDGDYPEYVYLTASGDDHHEHAFGMLSPFRLFDGLPINRVPGTDDPEPKAYPPAIELLASIFPAVQERYGFDFVRLDYVDHVFDSTYEGSWELPISDRLTPAILEKILSKAREKRPETGAMAERMGTDVDDYGALGFDLLLGSDVLTAMHAGYVSFLFNLQRQLDSEPEKNSKPSKSRHDGRRCSVLAAVDTHDSGHPLFWTKPLSQVVGADGMALRHFLARFATCGPRRRPKYECMGNQDLSYGLYETNNHATSLHWKDDRAFNQRYHALEDLYAQWRPFLAFARLGPSEVNQEEGWAAWFLDHAHGLRERLLCVAALEPALSQKQWLKKPPKFEAVGPIRVAVTLGMEMLNPVVEEWPLDGGKPIRIKPKQGLLQIERLPGRSCRLFRIHDGG
jgi:hypothetical protein